MDTKKTVLARDRVSAAECRATQCPKYHGGNHTIARWGDGSRGECQGCGTFYLPPQIRSFAGIKDVQKTYERAAIDRMVRR